jgi:hypothetical protein
MKKCPKCQGEMEEGFIGDNSHGGGALKQKWGKQITKTLGINMGVEDGKEVETYRCKNCAYLESYTK